MSSKPETTEPYLQVTYRHGRSIAAYYHLPHRIREKSHRTPRREPGLVVDFNRSGRPIGIEITAPRKTSVAAFNRVLKSLGLAPVAACELAPLRAA